MGADADLCKGVGGLCLVYARKYKSLNGMEEVGFKNAIKLHAFYFLMYYPNSVLSKNR